MWLTGSSVPHRKRPILHSGKWEKIEQDGIKWASDHVH